MKIFLSSTYVDLVSIRRNAIEYLKSIVGDVKGKTGEIVAMEFFDATERTCKQECLHQLESSNLVIGIYGEKYGSIDPETGLSMTEVEFDFALAHNIPILAFVMRTPNRETREADFIHQKVFARGLSCANFEGKVDFLNRLEESLKSYLGDLDGYSVDSIWSEIVNFRNDLAHGITAQYGPNGIQMFPFLEDDEEKVLDEILFSAKCLKDIQSDLIEEHSAVYDFASKFDCDHAHITNLDVMDLAEKVGNCALTIRRNWENIYLGLSNHTTSLILQVSFLKLKRMERRLATEPWTEKLRQEVISARNTYWETIKDSKYVD